MITLLWILYIMDSLFLIGIILIQPGEGGDLAAAFGGASSQTAFGARGSTTFLQKVTTSLAVLFMVLSIVLVILTNWKHKNIMEKNLPVTKQETPAAAPAVPGKADSKEAKTDTETAGKATEGKPTGEEGSKSEPAAPGNPGTK